MTYVCHEETAECSDGFELTLKIKQDEDPLNPRKDYDNLGTMVCWHRRADLGDRTIRHDEVEDFFEELKAIQKKGGVVLPLWLYEHGGMTMSCGEGNPYSCQWDSGQVGFIYATAEDIRENWGIKRISKKKREHAIEILKGEVDTYDKMLTGDVWGYDIEDENGDHVDSCWGFFGDKYAIEEGQDMLAYYVKSLSEKRAAEKKEENEAVAVTWVEETWKGSDENNHRV